ncbi:MAG TPA: UDP-N-acetylmuramoyl-tripeptide--D-alanyl-D-alanine ligase [Gammaproteobacteria bacterium]
MLTRKIQQLKNIYWFARGNNSTRAVSAYLRKQLLIATAYLWRRLLFNTTFIAITGSVGKTTTKEFLSDILAQHYPVMKTPGNANLRRFKGLEETILKTRPWHRYAVVELGIEKPGDMASAARFLKPDMAVVLDIKHCHTNVFKSLESIAEEKSQLVKALDKGDCAVLNKDNNHVAAMAAVTKARIISFGTHEQAEFRMLNATSRWPERLTLAVSHNNNHYKVETRLIGTHWSNTIMASLAAAHECGISIPDAIKAIRTIEPFWARMQPITLPNKATIIRDDWNGSIDTFEVALQFLQDAEATRKIVVFSDFSDSRKKLRSRANYLGKIAATHADHAVFVGDYADRSTQSAIEAGMDPESVHDFFNLSDAIDFLKKELREGDLVLIKGQANHHLSRIYLGLLGDVTCSLPSCSKQILCDRCPDLGFEWTHDMAPFRAAPGSSV